MTKINISTLLRNQCGNSITAVPCSIDLEETLEFNDLNLCDLDIHALLAEHRQVAIIWCIEDVQEIRPDLDDDQCWAVLQRCERLHDCNDGFNWYLIEAVAEDLFPKTQEGDAQ